MSAIYFNSLDGNVRVSGSERAHFGVTCSGITWSILSRAASEYGERNSVLRLAIPEGHYAHKSSRFEYAAKGVFAGMLSEGFVLDGQEYESFSLQLNTALRMGSDFLKLAARLHGQCEIHAYVEGKNRKWLADIIRQGRKFKFYRGDMGWEKVIDLLEKSDESPIVTSYSVTEDFPNPYISDGFEPKSYIDEEDGKEYQDYDEWYEIPFENQWKMAVDGLRKENTGLELKPDNWSDFYFRHGIDANMLLARLYEQPELAI